MYEYMNQVIILLPEIFLSISACILLMLGVFIKSWNFRNMNLVVGIVLAVALYFLIAKTPETEIFAFERLFKSNMLILNLKSILLCGALLYILIYKGQQFNETSMLKLYEFPIILLFAIVGMLLMLSANNFLSFYVSLELQSLCLYVLAAFEREDPKASEASVKYFVIGSFASGLLLFGISLIYGFTGNLDFSNLQELIQNNPSQNIALGVIIGIVMLLIGLFFKVSAAPFHMWTPDVYQGSPTIVTSLFATIVKVASVGFLLRFTVEVLQGWKLELQPVLIFVACLSLLIGAIGALKQNNIKRLLAYSSIGHVGFMLIAIASFVPSSAVLFYLVIYLSMTIAIFAIIMGLNIVNLEDFAGLSKYSPITAAAIAILMFSLAGIPPFAGFFAKFYALQEAIRAELYVTVAISIIAAVISAYYYLKIVKLMYFDEAKEQLVLNMSIDTKLIISILVIFNLCYILS